VIRGLGGRLGARTLDAIGRALGRRQRREGLAVDLLSDDEAYLAVFDAPGGQGRDVRVRYEDGAVHVRVERFREDRPGFELVVPGRARTLTGRVELPADAAVDPEAATATVRGNGTVRVRVPKVDDDDRQL